MRKAAANPGPTSVPLRELRRQWYADWQVHFAELYRKCTDPGEQLALARESIDLADSFGEKPPDWSGSQRGVVEFSRDRLPSLRPRQHESNARRRMELSPLVSLAWTIMGLGDFIADRYKGGRGPTIRSRLIRSLRDGEQLPEELDRVQRKLELSDSECRPRFDGELSVCLMLLFQLRGIHGIPPGKPIPIGRQQKQIIRWVREHYREVHGLETIAGKPIRKADGMIERELRETQSRFKPLQAILLELQNSQH